MVVYTLQQPWEILRHYFENPMPILLKKVIFSVEANFDLGGYVNKPVSMPDTNGKNFITIKPWMTTALLKKIEKKKKIGIQCAKQSSNLRLKEYYKKCVRL